MRTVENYLEINFKSFFRIKAFWMTLKSILADLTALGQSNYNS